ncbi:MAG: hypothetical protein II969_01475 [Anaerolineaceae bacterium]|nr:hypothetical protein [Anaerolineaceae bacterium]
MYYLIKTALEPCTANEIRKADVPFVAVLTSGEWTRNYADFHLDIDMELDTDDPHETKAIVNMDSLTGTFCRPALTQNENFHGSFSFALDERGIVLVDDSDYVKGLVAQISKNKKWRLPSLERFIYDLLETAINEDLPLLEQMEKKLNKIEDEIMDGNITGFPVEMNDIRGDLLDLRVHYEQLIDLGQELLENENDFFGEENLRYFHMFTERAIRLQSLVSSQREYVSQLRDLLQAQLEVKQNTIMTVLTVITTIFLPLTLIAGWYGMNFTHMPELSWPYGYPVIIIISIIIVITCLIWFKKKKWM